MGAGTAAMVVFAGGTIGAYKPTGYTDRVDLFRISDPLPKSRADCCGSMQGTPQPKTSS